MWISTGQPVTLMAPGNILLRVFTIHQVCAKACSWCLFLTLGSRHILTKFRPAPSLAKSAMIDNLFLEISQSVRPVHVLGCLRIRLVKALSAHLSRNLILRQMEATFGVMLVRNAQMRYLIPETMVGTFRFADLPMYHAPLSRYLEFAPSMYLNARLAGKTTIIGLRIRLSWLKITRTTDVIATLMHL